MAWAVAALPGHAQRGCTLRPVTMPNDLVVLRPEGLYCPAGDFYIDPWRPVERAVLTHAHSDHARRGSALYLAHADSAGTLRNRLGADIALQTLAYGEAITHQGVTVSLHPAGHVLGSAQVRIEHAGHPHLACMLNAHLGRAQHMPGRVQRHRHALVRDGFAVGQGLQGDVCAQPVAQRARAVGVGQVMGRTAPGVV